MEKGYGIKVMGKVSGLQKALETKKFCRLVEYFLDILGDIVHSIRYSDS